PGAKRRFAADELFLQPALLLAEHGARERRAGAEAAKQRALPNPRGLGHLVHRDAAGSALLEQPARLAEDALAIARRIGPLGQLGLDLRQLKRRGHANNCTKPDRSPIVCYAVHT